MMPNRIRTFAAVVEIATGLALIVEPRFVIGLLVSTNEPLQAFPLGRVAGIAMLALGLACWPGASGADASKLRGMLAYNALVALYLPYLYTVGHLGGVLLWPAVALHAAVALLLAKAWRDTRASRAGSV